MAFDWGSTIGGILGAGIGSFGGPGMAIVGGSIGAGIGGAFGGGGDEEVYDPLAGLRAQLQGLAGQVPGYIGEMKTQLGKQYAAAEAENLKALAEEYKGVRGFGETSIEKRIASEMREQMARDRGMQEAELDLRGIGLQKDILMGVGGLQQAPEEQPAWYNKLLGAGMGLAGQQLAYGDMKDFYGTRDAVAPGGGYISRYLHDATASPSYSGFGQTNNRLAGSQSRLLGNISEYY